MREPTLALEKAEALLKKFILSPYHVSSHSIRRSQAVRHLREQEEEVREENLAVRS